MKARPVGGGPFLHLMGDTPGEVTWPLNDGGLCEALAPFPKHARVCLAGFFGQICGNLFRVIFGCIDSNKADRAQFVKKT